jgi:hypothetical protein
MLTEFQYPQKPLGRHTQVGGLGRGHWFRLKASGGLLWQVSASLRRPSFIGLDTVYGYLSGKVVELPFR